MKKCFESFSRSNEKIAARRASERREQLRAVQAHVRKDDGRLHAYGWSLPAKGGAGGSPVPPRSQNSSGPPQVPVPVPVYCRPLMEKEDGMKVKRFHSHIAFEEQPLNK